MHTIIRDNYDPVLNEYHEIILIDSVKKKTWLFDCDGVYTDITKSVVVSERGDSEEWAASQKWVTEEVGALLDSLNSLEQKIADEAEERAQEDIEINQRIDKEVGDLQRKSDDLSERVETIEEKIPNAASKENQLADKDFVNSSVSTNTAYYISDDGEPFESVEALEAYEGDLTNNDYAFVTGTDDDGNTYFDRYKYNAEEKTWAKEYRLNNSSFTADQWAAINSGITSGLVEKLASMENVEVVQEVGDSETAVMSQKASTKMIYAEGSAAPLSAYVSNDTIAIGTDAGNVAPVACVYIGKGARYTGTSTGGSPATVIGPNATSETSYSPVVVIGQNSAVTGQAPAIAMGLTAKAHSPNSTSIGHNTVAGTEGKTGGTNELAIGSGAKAYGPNAVAIGAYNTAGQEGATYVNAVSIGYQSIASGNSSVAIGGGSAYSKVTASGDSSTAIGGYANASGEGSFAASSGSASKLGSVAIGYRGATSSGQGAIAIGYSGITSSGDTSIAIGGYNSKATGNGAIAIGTQSTEATANGAIAIGRNEVYSRGQYSCVIGSSYSYASGDYSYAIGSAARVDATGAYAIGYVASASKDASNGIAIGSSASVSAPSSVALGHGASASVANTIAIRNTIDKVDRRITGLAEGVNDTDAVNVGQMKEAIASITPGESSKINEEDWEALWQ